MRTIKLVAFAVLTICISFILSYAGEIGTLPIGNCFGMGINGNYQHPWSILDQAQAVGCNLVRDEEFNEDPNQTLDNFYLEATRRKIYLLPLVNINPVPVNAADRDAYANRFLRLVNRYGPGGTLWHENASVDSLYAPVVWEIMNEPYVGVQGGPYNPSGYAQLVKRVSEVVKAVHPKIKLTAAHETTYFNPGNPDDGKNWLDALYTAVPNLGDYFDLVAVHPYAHDPSPGDPNARWNFRRIENIRARLIAKGINKDFWITELGNPTNCTSGSGHTEAEQAEYLQEYVDLCKGYGYVRAYIHYCYPDFGSSPADCEQHFGVVRYDGSHKPAFDVLRRNALSNPYSISCVSVIAPPVILKKGTYFLRSETFYSSVHAAVFGPGVDEVTLYNLQGKKFFYTSRSKASLSPIVWNCCNNKSDPAGHELFLARIHTQNDLVYFQKFMIQP